MVSTTIDRLGPVARRLAMLLMALALMGLPLYAGPDSAAGDEHGEQELSVDEILARHYEAIGGDHHQGVSSMKTVGRSIVMGMEAPYTRFSKRPNKVLLEIYVQGMTGVQAFDGETAWWFMPFMGQAAPELMPSDMAVGMREGSEFDGPLVSPDQKGHTVELLGRETVQERETYKLQVALATGGVQTYYVDIESFYIVRMESAQGDADFLDYMIVEGHPVPTVIEMMGPMGEQIVYIDEVEFDVALDDAIFSMQ